MTTITAWLKKELYDQSAEKNFLHAPSVFDWLSEIRMGVKRCNAKIFGTTSLGLEKGLFATSRKKTFGDWSVFINLLQSRLSFVSQIYTSVLKTKVKLIEYAFETLPAWILSMPPSKARKYNQIINNVGGKLKASHNWLKTRYREKKIHNCCFSYSFTVFHFSRV